MVRLMMAGQQPLPSGTKKRSDLQTLIALIRTMYEVCNMPMRKLMSTMHQNVDVSLGITIFEDVLTKSTITANDLKNQGTEQFIAGTYDKAIVSFTRCLAFTTDGSEEAAVAFANRSAVLFKFGQYRECIADVDRALSGPYPDDKRQKLIDRKERCLALVEAETKDSASIRRGDAKAKEAAEWRKMSKGLNNPLIPNASSKIKLGYDEAYGRHWLAADNIKPGEILCTETFYTTIKTPKVQYEYCSHCLSLCLALIPCPTCSQAMYCSEFCRTEAHTMYHRLECQFLALKEIRPHYLDMGEMLVLRTLLIGTKQGAGLKTLMEELPMEDILMDNYDPSDKPYKCDYWHVLRLRRTFPKPLFNHTIKLEIIVATVIALRKVGFFGSDLEQEGADEGEKRMSEPELYTALLLYNHMISLKLSFKAVRVMVESDTLIHNDILIGLGVCTVCNMINHSCNPQIRPFLRDRQLVMLACRPIKKGEQIFESYCRPYWQCSYVQRFNQLTDTHAGYDRFACRCEACYNVWPTYSELRAKEIQFQGEDVRQMQEEFSGIVLSFVKEPVDDISKEEILQFFCVLSTWMHDRIRSPAFPIVDCEELLFGYMAYFYSVGWVKERTVAGWRRNTNVNVILNNILLSRLFPDEKEKEFLV